MVRVSSSTGHLEYYNLQCDKTIISKIGEMFANGNPLQLLDVVRWLCGVTKTLLALHKSGSMHTNLIPERMYIIEKDVYISNLTTELRGSGSTDTLRLIKSAIDILFMDDSMFNDEWTIDMFTNFKMQPSNMWSIVTTLVNSSRCNWPKDADSESTKRILAHLATAFMSALKILEDTRSTKIPNLLIQLSNVLEAAAEALNESNVTRRLANSLKPFTKWVYEDPCAAKRLSYFLDSRLPPPPPPLHEEAEEEEVEEAEEEEEEVEEADDEADETFSPSNPHKKQRVTKAYK